MCDTSSLVSTPRSRVVSPELSVRSFRVSKDKTLHLDKRKELVWMVLEQAPCSIARATLRYMDDEPCFGRT